MTINFLGMVDKRNIFLLLGCYCNSPKLATNKQYETNANDYNELFHKMIWGAITNIAKKGKASKITAMEIENELSQFPTALESWNINNGWEYVEKAIEETEDKVCNVGMYHDNVRKYSMIREASDGLKMDVSFIYDEKDENKINLFNNMTSKEVLISLREKFKIFTDKWKNQDEQNRSFRLSDGLENRIKEYKNKDNTYGYPFQSGYLTTVFRGMRSKKYTIISSKSGGGKSRGRMAEACNIASDQIYDWNKKKWVNTGDKSPVLFISTELSKEEIQDCLLAHVTGIDEDRLTAWDNITKEEEKVIEEAALMLQDSVLYGEEMPDFTIDSIVEMIEEHVIKHDIEYCFFDYINDSPSLYQYYKQKTGLTLGTHQMLYMFSMELKNICNKYNIYLGSSTQLSSNYKDEKDSNAIKGSKAIIEKADGGVIALPATSHDLKKLDKILKQGFIRKPNMAYYIYKNRGGKWNNIIIWTQINLGTVREVDCFVTNNDYELIDNIEKTLIEFQLEDIGSVTLNNSIEDEDTDVNEFIQDYRSTKID